MALTKVNSILVDGAINTDASGNVGIGTSSPTQKLVVSNGGAAGVEINPTTGNIFTFNRSTSVYTDMVVTSNNTIFQTGGATESMRIDSSGNLLVNTAATTGNLEKMTLQYPANSNNGLYIKNTYAGVGVNIGFVNSSNTLVGNIQSSTTATSYVTTSDYRLKENIAPITGALASVSALKPVTYKWKSNGSDGQGFIAHELQEVVPDCVTGEKDAVDAEGNPQYQGIDTSFLVATLTAAIQELNAKVDAQAAEIAELKAR